MSSSLVLLRDFCGLGGFASPSVPLGGSGGKSTAIFVFFVSGVSAITGTEAYKTRSLLFVKRFLSSHPKARDRRVRLARGHGHRSRTGGGRREIPGELGQTDGYPRKEGVPALGGICYRFALIFKIHKEK